MAHTTSRKLGLGEGTAVHPMTDRVWYQGPFGAHLPTTNDLFIL